MDKNGHLDIRVVGKSGNELLTPDNYDIRQIASILNNVEALLYPEQKRDRPIITYELQQGSVLHRFSTSLQCIIGFSAILGQIQQTASIDFLDLKSAEAIEDIQNLAQQTHYEFQFYTSITDGLALKIDADTAFQRTATTWADAELYFYGTLKNAGGKEKANIHLDTAEHGYLTIAVEQADLRAWKENPLYKNFGIRAMGKQSIETGEIDKKSLKLVELIDYQPQFDHQYLSQLIHRAKPRWQEIDPDQWLQQLRGEYEG